MSAMLNDVDAAMKEADAPSVVFSPCAAAHAGGNTNADFVSEQQGATTEGGVPNVEGEVDDIRLEESEDDTDEGDEERDDEPMPTATETIVPFRSVAADLPQSTVITDSSCLGGDIGEHQTVDSPARSSFANDEVRCAAWNMGIDAPSMELFEEGTDDYEFFVGNKLDTPSCTTPTRTSNDAKVATPTADIPSAETPPDEVCIPATYPVVLEKDVPTVEVVDIVTPSEPKTADATSGFQTHEKKNSKEFVRIGRYFCSYKTLFESLKPRHYLDSEDKLIVDPAAFDLDSCMKELNLVNTKFKILKDDLLFMDNFDAKVMAHFDNNAIPDH
ncbi:hypothetical protein ACQ4PT_060834 [Festuca glaucescens]